MVFISLYKTISHGLLKMKVVNCFIGPGSSTVREYFWKGISYLMLALKTVARTCSANFNSYQQSNHLQECVDYSFEISSSTFSLYFSLSTLSVSLLAANWKQNYPILSLICIFCCYSSFIG